MFSDADDLRELITSDHLAHERQVRAVKFHERLEIGLPLPDSQTVEDGLEEADRDVRVNIRRNNV